MPHHTPHPRPRMRLLSPSPTPQPPEVFSPGRLRAYRVTCALTHATLAHRAGLNTATVAAIETGTHTPTTDEITKLADALNHTPQHLYGPHGADPHKEYWRAVCGADTPTPQQWAHDQLTNAPHRSTTWARKVAAIYRLNVDDETEAA